MKSFSVFFGMLVAVVVIAVLLLIFGVSFRPQPTVVTYNPATETTISGVVQELQDYRCPVSEGEIGSHLVVKTDQGLVHVHLAAARIMRSQDFKLAVGDQITVVGSKIRVGEGLNLMAREITRGNEIFTLRNPNGVLLLMQR
ncbi:MAG TPA: hypothetical protein VEG30_14935 [Terriglobales bacterium]|nr:hypothetical protein [Terriglobales bacterium]